MTKSVTIDGELFVAEAADKWLLHGVDSGVGHHVRELRHFVRTVLAVHHLVDSLRLWVYCLPYVIHTSIARPSLGSLRLWHGSYLIQIWMFWQWWFALIVPFFDVIYGFLYKLLRFEQVLQLLKPIWFENRSLDNIGTAVLFNMVTMANLSWTCWSIFRFLRHCWAHTSKIGFLKGLIIINLGLTFFRVSAGSLRSMATISLLLLSSHSTTWLSWEEPWLLCLDELLLTSWWLGEDP